MLRALCVNQYEKIFEKLTESTLALKKGIESAHQANERALLTAHLAAASAMYTLLHSHGNAESAREIIKTEIRGHGWSFISGQPSETIAKDGWHLLMRLACHSKAHKKLSLAPLRGCGSLHAASICFGCRKAKR